MAKKPKVPKPYRPPDDEDDEKARERERQRRAQRQGAASTILAGARGAENRPNVGAVTLGGT